MANTKPLNTREYSDYKKLLVELDDRLEGVFESSWDLHTNYHDRAFMVGDKINHLTPCLRNDPRIQKIEAALKDLEHKIMWEKLHA